MTDPDAPDLGPCCACGGTTDVRNIVMLDASSPIPGRGWGCLQCGLDPDGAVAVVCDRCHADDASLTHACRGFPVMDGRIPIGELTGSHRHDMSRHPGEE